MSINKLRKELKGNVLRKSKFLLELYVPGEDSVQLPILQQSVSLPQRTISSVKVWHKGRPFNLRGETQFGDNVTITFLETQAADIRRMMDLWMKAIDDSGSVFESQEKPGIQGQIQKASKEVNSQISQVNNIKSMKKDLNQLIDFASNSKTLNQFPQYQVHTRIWQLDGSGNKVYGYELQNSFLTGISDGDFQQSENSAQTVSITLTYSEVIHLQGKVLSTVGKLFGDDVSDTIQRVKSFKL